MCIRDRQNNATVRGSVKDATGESLIGVSVTVKGKEGVGTITDVDGNYSICLLYTSAT